MFGTIRSESQVIDMSSSKEQWNLQHRIEFKIHIYGNLFNSEKLNYHALLVLYMSNQLDTHQNLRLFDLHGIY
jgi:hypothetical protein